MDDYFAILTLKSPIDAQGVRLLWRQACLDLYRVEWVRAYLSQDGARMLCWYRSPDAESVRFILRQQGSDTGTVWRANVTGDDDTRLESDGAHRVIVGAAGEKSSGHDQLAKMQAEIGSTLQREGYPVTRQFSTVQGNNLVFVVRGRDVNAVSDCLRDTGVSPDAVWSCLELDPNPDELFQPSASAKHSGDGKSARTSHERKSTQYTQQGGRDSLGASGDYDAVIIGAGISGIAMLERLLRMNLRVVVFESGSDIGGVWHWNRYPGARVDSESFTYAFDFAGETLRKWRWRELFAAQPEVFRYLDFVVKSLDMRRFIRTGTRVAEATWHEAGKCWTVTTDSGETVSTSYLIAATGALSAPQLPDFPGIEEFTGPSHHTARWPAGEVEMSGKSVGVIGTGATGVQVIQTIASEVRQLTVFQRTPTYCVPQRNRHLSDAEWQDIQRNLVSTLATCRNSFSGFMHVFDPQPGMTLSPQEREKKFETLWQLPGFAFWFANFGDLLMNSEVNAHACEFVRRKIMARVHNPETARKLLPDHPFGAKRVPLENGYYEVFNRDNVRLVDLRESPIDRVTKHGILTASGEEIQLDVIVYATGFDAGTGALTRIDVRGVNGITMADKWRLGAKTYLGLMVHGFPNLFIVNGPQNSAALCNATRCIEYNADWIARCIGHLLERGLARIEPTVESEEKWTWHVEEVARASVLGEMTESWFFGANTPGKARAATIYAAGASAYRAHCEKAARSGYPGVEVSSFA